MIISPITELMQRYIVRSGEQWKTQEMGLSDDSPGKGAVIDYVAASLLLCLSMPSTSASTKWSTQAIGNGCPDLRGPCKFKAVSGVDFPVSWGAWSTS